MSETEVFPHFPKQLILTVAKCEEDVIILSLDILDSPEVDVDLVSADCRGRGPAPGQEEGPDPPVELDQGGPPGGVGDHLRGDLHTLGHAAHSETRVIKSDKESFTLYTDKARVSQV